jgi:hypothetical protein
MKITYYLKQKRVEKAVFRTFSSRSDNWLAQLEKNKALLERISGELQLVYSPVENNVLPFFNKEPLAEGADYKGTIADIAKVINDLVQSPVRATTIITNTAQLPRTLQKVK